MDFMGEIVARAKQAKKTIVMPEGEDIRVIEATAIILEQGIANVVLLGNEDEIKKSAKGFDVSGARIIDIERFDKIEEYAEMLYELRKAKGMTKELALETMKDPLYFGVMAVKKGEADGMVAGAVHPTGDTLRPALQILKTAPGIKVASSFFFMTVPDCEFGSEGLFMFSDCALIVNPTAEELSDIAVTAAESFRNFVRKEPIVAMLSYSTCGSAKGGLADKVIEATRLAKEKAPGLQLDGELQLDAALIEEIGRSKAPGSKVAGKANVLIFPDLNSGNIGYKLVQRLAKAHAYGPVLQGMAKPVNDLSRGCSADDIVSVTALTCVQAAQSGQ